MATMSRVTILSLLHAGETELYFQRARLVSMPTKTLSQPSKAKVTLTDPVRAHPWPSCLRPANSEERDSDVYANDKPGLGIELDEKESGKVSLREHLDDLDADAARRRDVADPLRHRSRELGAAMRGGAPPTSRCPARVVTSSTDAWWKQLQRELRWLNGTRRRGRHFFQDLAKLLRHPPKEWLRSRQIRSACTIPDAVELAGRALKLVGRVSSETLQIFTTAVVLLN